MGKELIEEAKEILMLFGKEGCTIADSGGKDSSVVKRIAEICREKYGLQYKIVHNHTGLDAPETVYFVRSEKERAERAGIEYNINYPKITFDRLCVKKQMLPTRIARFCCEYLKENYGNRNERLVTGVRKSESVNRKQNQGIVTIPSKDIPDEVWKDEDVWKFITDEKIPVNPLYGCGYKRVGCIGCPMSGYKGRMEEFARYPKYKERFIRIADRVVETMKEKRGDAYKGEPTGLLYFKKWLEDPNTDGQFSFDMDGNIKEDYT